MKKLVPALAAAILFAAPAFADKPDSTFVPNPSGKPRTDRGCGVGAGASQIIQNGQFVSGNNDAGIDQTTTPGSRADAVAADRANNTDCRANNG